MDNIQPGQMLGPYRIISQIGVGGMATVYKAYQAAMDRYVAVKVLPSQFAQSPEFTGRFQQEARTIANLEHPHILPVHDYGESGGITYFVMRYMDTGTLKDRIASGPLSLTEIDRLFTQLVNALGYAHERGVIHRDVKPSNALVDPRGDLFLTDFGIAKLAESAAQFTATGTITGTPAYMSPEQAQGEKLDQRSDIYSLGIVLYEMVTGRVPFEAETPLAVILKQMQAPLPPPSSVKPDVSPAVERVLLKALAKSRDERYSTCADFLAGWKAALQEARGAAAGVRAPSRAGAAAPPLEPTAAAPSAAAPTEAAAPARAGRGLPLPWILGCLGLLGAAAAAVALAVVLLGPRLPLPLAATAATTSRPPPTPAPGTAAPVLTPRPDVTTGMIWTSWTAANWVNSIAVVGDQVYAGGPGGVTVWNRTDGTVLRRLTTADGLPSPWVEAVLVEEDGTLWIGTDTGLAHFDGQEWTIYDPADGLDSYNVIAITRIDGDLVVGTYYSGRDGGGLNLFDGRSWRALPDFPSADPEANPEALANFVNAVVRDSAGILWVATTNGLGRYDGQSWRRYSTADGLPGNNVFTLALDRDGTLLAGTDAGAARLAGEAFEALAQGPPVGIYGIAQDSTGRYWLSGDGGIWRFDPARANWDEFSQQTGHLPAYTVLRSAQDADGNLYFGSFDGGLLRYDGSKFTSWTVPNVPHYPAAGRILQAPDGLLWFVEEYGVSVDRYDPGRGTWSPGLDLPGAPLAFDGDGNVWVAEYNNGFWVIGADRTHVGPDEDLPADHEVRAVAFAPDGTAWIATDKGLVSFDGADIADIFVADDTGLPSDVVRTVFAASDGSIWAGGEFGLSRLTPDDDWVHYGAGNPFEHDVPVMDIAEDADGAIWVATSGLGVYRFAGDTWQRVQAGGPGSQLPSPDVNSITLAPDGSLWFGTRNGAARFHNNDWQVFRAAGGLIHPNVNDIYVDPSGAAWFATSGGTTRLGP